MNKNILLLHFNIMELQNIDDIIFAKYLYIYNILSYTNMTKYLIIIKLTTYYKRKIYSTNEYIIIFMFFSLVFVLCRSIFLSIKIVSPYVTYCYLYF